MSEVSTKPKVMTRMKTSWVLSKRKVGGGSFVPGSENNRKFLDRSAMWERFQMVYMSVVQYIAQEGFAWCFLALSLKKRDNIQQTQQQPPQFCAWKFIHSALNFSCTMKSRFLFLLLLLVLKSSIFGAKLPPVLLFGGSSLMSEKKFLHTEKVFPPSLLIHAVLMTTMMREVDSLPQ